MKKYLTIKTREKEKIKPESLQKIKNIRLKKQQAVKRPCVPPNLPSEQPTNLF